MHSEVTKRASVAGIGAGAGGVHYEVAEGSDVGGRPAPHFLCLSTPLGAKSATPAQGRNRGDPLIPWRALRLKLAHRNRPYHLGVFALEDDAQDWQARIQSLLSRKEDNT